MKIEITRDLDHKKTQERMVSYGKAICAVMKEERNTKLHTEGKKGEDYEAKL